MKVTSEIHKQARNTILRVLRKSSSNSESIARKIAKVNDVELIVAGAMTALDEISRTKLALEDAITDLGYDTKPKDRDD